MPAATVAPIDMMGGLAALRLRLQARPHTLDDVETLTEADRERLEADWELWLRTLFRSYVSRKTGDPIPFAERHRELWDWAWSIELGTRLEPMVVIWPRGGAKSTTAELATVSVGARGVRRYALYVSGTQDKADDHVQNVGGMLESAAFGRVYPRLAQRMLTKYGSSKGWRRNRLRTAAGFTVDALGLDTAARGIKLEDARPDLIIIDDVDEEGDTPATIAKKIKALTHKILPAGSTDLIVLFVQNLIHPDSIASRLVDGRADFLADRIVSGPHKAVEGLDVEQREVNGRLQFVIVAGRPTWEGQDLETCQHFISTWGYKAFLTEAQQEVQAKAGGIYSHLEGHWIRINWEEMPDLVRVVVALDPAVSDTEESDCHGINVDGLGEDKKVYRLFTWEERGSPRDAITKALHKCGEYGADTLVVETDQGGDLWKGEIESVFRDNKDQLREAYGMMRLPRFAFRKAGSEGSKVARAQQQVVDYERGEIVHVRGSHVVIEAALFRFPNTKPLDAADASYWSWRELRRGGMEKVRGSKPIGIPKSSKWR